LRGAKWLASPYQRCADGAIRFIGRYENQLKVGGENIDPAEVESFLPDHPAISEVQVVGAPDDRLGKAQKFKLREMIEQTIVEGRS
jgi:acyl-CoA synthetase (AMP-forming)/AMP-acid ligase II